MASQTDHERDGRTYSQGDLESPFLQEELLGRETEDVWQAHLETLEAESPFLSAFQPRVPIASESEEREEEFLEEGEFAWERDKFPTDEAETYHVEAEESGIERKDEEVAYPLEEFPYAGEEPSLAGLPGVATWPPAFAAALAAGNRDENQLTDLIFYTRHKELERRKLTQSDPQAWKDEWVSILKTIVRPALGRLKEAKTQPSVGSVPDKRRPHPSLQPLQLSPNCIKTVKNTRVAVVGAGLGGLMAALRLAQHGVQVTVYEARTEVGGRVQSDYGKISLGRITEKGAELIGSFHTSWLTLAREYGLTVINRMTEEDYARTGLQLKLRLGGGVDLSAATIDKLGNEMDGVLEKIAEEAKKVTDLTKPWADSNLKTYDNLSVEDALQQKPYNLTKGEPVWKALQFKLENDEVAPLDKMNYLGLLCKVKGGQGDRLGTNEPNPMGYWHELEIFRCADGCQTLAKKMEEEINAWPGCRVVRQTAVTGITIHERGVTLATWSVTAGGDLHKPDPISKIDAHYVILAIPPKVWGRVKIHDQRKKVDVDLKVEIGELTMGDAVKCFSAVKERFWIEEGAAPSGGSMTLGQIWEGTDNQTQLNGQGIVLSVFAGPIRTDKSGNRRPPTQDEMEKELRAMYKGYSESKPKLHYANWPEEKFIKTGYWSPAPGEIFKIGDKLVKPLRDRLFFAGDFTQLDSFGYMEGALRSGIRAAEDVMLQSCGPRKESDSPVLTASTAPIRGKTAFEQESRDEEFETGSIL